MSTQPTRVQAAQAVQTAQTVQAVQTAQTQTRTRTRAERRHRHRHRHHHSPGIRPTPWTIAATATLAIVTAGAFTTLAGLLVGPLHEEFGWSRSAIGVGTLVNMALYGVAAPFSAALMDRFGMRRVATAALALVGAGAGLAMTMTAPWQFVLYWGVFVGLGTGATATAFAATVTERWFVARRGLVTGLLTAASVLGQFLFLPVLSEVIDAYAWRAAAGCLAVAAAGAVLIVGLVLRDRPADVGRLPYGADGADGADADGAEGADGPREFTSPPSPAPHAAGRAVRVLLRSAGTAPFLLLAGTFAVCGASTNGVMWTHFAPAAHDHGMPVTVAASLLSLIGIFNVAGTVGSGWLTDRVDARRLLAVCYALRGLSLLALPLLLTATVQPPLVAFVIVFGLLDVATVPPTLALCRAYHGADAPVVFGWINAAHQLGAGLVAFLGGAARDVSGSYDMVWVAAGALCAVAALMALTLRGRRR
ncbi:MFS transporter [Streptomyces jeddahensis]|uniref:Major facilitator superfamily protein n=1 Tax=Streptomyces jeddahensis TaxID=1716141 RepID=A0A177HWW1_9ACTN|nr:MFS transporter [Streptomyces jeddahensis]OAH15170.1 major facilitator superfamily protein [Streptomyces jeddahensis]